MLFDDDLIPRRQAAPRPNNENVLNLLPKETPPVQKTERYYSMHSPKVEAKTRTMATMGLNIIYRKQFILYYILNYIGAPKTIVDPHKFQRKQDRSLPPGLLFKIALFFFKL